MLKNVLVDCERMKYRYSGLANVCRSLMAGFQYLSASGITLYGPKEILEQMSNLPIIPWRIFHKYFPANTFDFKVIHVTHQLSSYFHKIRKNQKKIVTVHDLNFLHDQSKARKVKKSTRLVQKNIGNADVLVFISDFVRQDFIKHQHLFKLNSNVVFEVIYNGLSFPEDKTFVAKRLDFLKKRKYILNIGVLHPKKNQMALLELLKETNEDLVLVASSKKENFFDHFQKKMKIHGFEDRVHLLENVDEEEKYFLLQNCESYVHPSLAEGFGIPPVEAFFFQKPVFLSRSTSLPEVGKHLAYYFDDFSADYMGEVYKKGMADFRAKNSEERRQLQEHALQYGFVKMAEKYLMLYKKMLSST